jgi:glycosyltransferase involved in cell wall biosynthesis
MIRCSVCLATFNGSKYLHDQVDSILKELTLSDELIVSDNNSDDDTLTILQSFNDSRVKIFHNPRNGVVDNFENALKNARGKYIFLSDQDDVWIEGKLQRCIDLLQENNLVLHNAYVINEKSTISNSIFDLINVKKSFLCNLIQNKFIGCCMAFRSNLLSLALPFPKHISMHDWWIAQVALSFGDVAIERSELMFFRRHIGNNSSTLSSSSRSLTKKVVDRLFLIYYIIKVKVIA